jgi:pimeloyl-ACP methyl ester carboxylesterase
LLTVAAASIAAPSANAQGVFRSDLCFEEIPFNTPEVIAAASDGVRAEIKRAGAIGLVNLDLDICAFWGARQPPALENQPVTSSVPALVLAGEYDPITPPAYGELAAQTLSNSFYFLFAGQGHGQLFNPLAPGCAINLVAAFLDDPTTRPDGSCVAALPPPHFVGS